MQPSGPTFCATGMNHASFAVKKSGRGFAAYVEPSRRPKDGRYGENPNRMQNFYQYQVLLKPAPDGNQFPVRPPASV